MVSRPQFSQFFGFGEVDKSKGVPYHVWRFEVNSAIRGGLYTNQVIAEQIRRSLQGEAKTKLVGLGTESESQTILEELDQFYSDVGAATGDEILAEAYRSRHLLHGWITTFEWQSPEELNFSRTKTLSKDNYACCFGKELVNQSRIKQDIERITATRSLN